MEMVMEMEIVVVMVSIRGHTSLTPSAVDRR